MKRMVCVYKKQFRENQYIKKAPSFEGALGSTQVKLSKL